MSDSSRAHGRAEETVLTIERAPEDLTPRWLAPAALVAAWAAFFAPALFLGRVFYFRDLFFFHRPLREVVVRALAQGEAPYLNAGLNLGQPVLADPSYAVFYPANLLYLVLPFNAAWNLVLSGHVLAAAVGTFLLARALGARRGPALAGAFVFAFSGPLVSSLNYYSVLLATSWAPWVFLGALAAWRRGGVAVPLTGLAMAAQGLACEPTPFAGTAVVLAVAWIVGLVRSGERGVHLVRGLAIAGIAALVLSVQLVPAAMWIPHTDRGAPLPFRESAAWWSLDPERLAELLAPHVNGNALADRAAEFWGGHLSDAGYPYVPRLYLGWLPLLLAPLAWRTRWGKAALALGAAGFLLALGHNLPGYEWIHRAIPILWITRYPEKFTLFGALGLALALSLATSSAEGARKRWIVVTATALLVAAGSLALGAWGVPPGGITEEQEALRSAAIVGALALGAVAAIVGVLFVSVRWRRIGALLVPVVALLDVTAFTWEVAKTRSIEDDERPPQLLTDAPRLRDTAIVPLVELQSDAFFAGGIDPYVAMQEALYPYSGLRWGVRYGVAGDISRTMSAASARRTEAVFEGLRAGSLGAARASGIGALVAAGTVFRPGLEEIARVRRDGIEIGLYGLVPPPAALARFEGDGTVEAHEDAPHRVEVAIDAKAPGAVVVMREAIPGWNARLDGGSVALETDGLGLIEVPVPAGRHTLSLAYSPPGLGAGFALSALGLGVAGAGLVRSSRRRRRSSKT